MAFFAISAGTFDTLIASSATPGPVSSELYSPKLDATGLFDWCEVAQSIMNEQEPERELFCPVCGMETTVVGIDAVVHYENPKDLDYVIASLDSG
jgi:hypothetical protein